MRARVGVRLISSEYLSPRRRALISGNYVINSNVAKASIGVFDRLFITSLTRSRCNCVSDLTRLTMRCISLSYVYTIYANYTGRMEKIAKGKLVPLTHGLYRSVRSGNACRKRAVKVRPRFMSQSVSGKESVKLPLEFTIVMIRQSRPNVWILLRSKNS